MLFCGFIFYGDIYEDIYGWLWMDDMIWVKIGFIIIGNMGLFL